MKTSVSLMLGSVVNTLEQRGEWLNGGRGAAKGMIDRLSANQVTPFGAAEHLEFWSRWWSGVCANGFLQGRDGRKPRRNEKGLHSRTYCPRMSVFNHSKGGEEEEEEEAAPSAWAHRCAGPGGGLHAPVESHASSLARLLKPMGLTSAATSEEKMSPQIHFVFESNMAPTPLRHFFFFFFCLSVGFPKFVSGRKAWRRLAPDACRGPTEPV